MKAVIIAAGMGTRLAGLGPSKPLVRMLGVPLIERVMGSAITAGVDGFFVVVGYRKEPLIEVLLDFSQRYGLPVTPILNEEWQRPNGVSVLKAAPFIQDPFFLLMSDHLFDPQILKAFMAADLDPNSIYLGVDTHVENHPLVDMDDVTRVLIEENRIRNIGKGLTRFNAFDTGIFRMAPPIFEALAQSIAAGDESLSGGVRLLGLRNAAFTFDIGKRFWIDVDDGSTYQNAQSYLQRHPHFQALPGARHHEKESVIQ